MKTKMNSDKRKFIFIAAAFAAVLLLALILFLYNGEKPSSASGIPEKLLSYNDNVLLVSPQGLQLVDSGGKSEWALGVPSSEAVVRTRGRYILLADIASNKLTLTYGGKQVGEYTSENKLISANVNRRGDIAAICDDSGYRGMAVLLGKNGREKYRWHCGDGYLTDVDLSANGRYIAASMLVTDDSEVRSKLVIIDTKSDCVLAQAEREDSAVGTVRFTDSGKIITVADNEIVGYGKNGEVRFEISFGGREVSDFNIDNENNMVIAVKNSRNNTTLEIYSGNGKLRGSYEASGELKHITVDGGVIAASLMRDVYCISSGGKLKSIETCDHEIKDLCLFGGGKKAFVLGGSGKYSIIKIK